VSRVFGFLLVGVAIGVLGCGGRSDGEEAARQSSGTPSTLATYEETCPQCGMRWTVSVVEAGVSRFRVEVDIENTGENGRIDLVFQDLSVGYLNSAQAETWKQQFAAAFSQRNFASLFRLVGMERRQIRSSEGTVLPAAVAPGERWQGEFEAIDGGLPGDTVAVILFFSPVNFERHPAGVPTGGGWATFQESVPFISLERRGSALPGSTATSEPVGVLNPFHLDRDFPAMGPIAGPHFLPDPVLAVGPEVIVVVTNHGVEIRSKQGGLIDQVAHLSSFFASVRRERETLLDPRVIFDPWSERFFIHAAGGIWMPCEIGTCVFHNFLAVSRTPNPRSVSSSDWHFFALDASVDGDSLTDHQIDYTRLGVNETSVFLVSVHPKAGLPGSEGGSAFTRIRILDKQQLLAGVNPEWKDISRFADPIYGRVGHVIIQPTISYTASEVFFLVSAQPGSCRIAVWGLDASSPATSLSHKLVGADTLPGSSCQQPPDAQQPDGVPPLSINQQPIVSSHAIYRDGSIWFAYHFAMNMGTDAVAVVRVVELDVSSWPQSISIKQDIILGEVGVWSFFPAIAVSSVGNVAFVYSRSSAGEYPSAYYTGRLASDPPNTLRPPTVLKAGNASQSHISVGGGRRWGDYLGAALDPVDDSVWLLGEYMETPDQWGTWIGNLDWK